MFKKAGIVLVFIALLCLSACNTLVPNEPAGDLYPAASVVQAEHISIAETVPEYKIHASKSMIMESEAKNKHFNASYVHLFTPSASARPPFDGSAFWICDDPQEMNQGNHYTNYILENGQLKQLQKHSFSKSYTLLGTTVQLELEYSLIEDQVLINYVPAARNLPYAEVYDTSRGIHECLVRFQLPLTDGQYACYYAKIDLETGTLTDFLSEFDQALFSHDTKCQYWCNNYNLIITNLYDPESSLYCYDISNKALKEYAPKHEQYEVRLHSWKEISDGLLCRFDYYSQDNSQEALESRLWKISRTDGSMTPIADGTQFDRLVSYGCSYALYQDSNKMFYVYLPTSNEYTALPDMKSLHQGLMSTFIYLNDQGEYCLYDATDNESVVLDIPEAFEKNRKYIDSYDGKKIASSYLDENGIYQLLVFDTDTNTFIELQRSSLTGLKEKALNWTEDNSKIIVTLDGPSDRQNFIIYDFS